MSSYVQTNHETFVSNVLCIYISISNDKNSEEFAICINTRVDVSSIRILLARKYATRRIDCYKHASKTFFKIRREYER